LHYAISTSVECLNKQTEGKHFEHQDKTKALMHHWVQMCPLVWKLRGEIKKSMHHPHTCMARKVSVEPIRRYL